MTLSDLAIAQLKDDLLDRGRLAASVSRTLGDAGLKTPLAVAIFGDWGTGKTSLMRLVQAGLPKGSLCLWFDAWRYARQEEALWRAMLMAVIEALRDALRAEGRLDAKAEADLDQLAERLYRSRTDKERGSPQLDLGAAASFGFDLLLRYASLNTVSWKEIREALKGDDAEKAQKLIRRAETERYRTHVNSLELFYRELGALLRRHGVHGDAGGRRMYVFVDDLDRCLPEEAVGALEAVKLFLDLEGCVFILGMDRRVVEQGIAVRYAAYDAKLGAPVDPQQYLDKVVQLPVTLPPLSSGQVARFLSSIGGIADAPLVKECHDLIRAGSPSNPRSVKRIVNALYLLHGLAGLSDRPDEAGRQDARRLAKLAIMQVMHADLYRRVADDPKWLTKLQEAAGGHARPDAEEERKMLDHPALRPLRNVLGAVPQSFGSQDDILRLVTLASSTA